MLKEPFKGMIGAPLMGRIWNEALLGLHIARHSQAPFMREDGNAAKRSSGLDNPARSVRDECIGGRSREDESVQSILEAEQREPRLRGSEGRSNSVYCRQWTLKQKVSTSAFKGTTPFSKRGLIRAGSEFGRAELST